MNEAVLDPFRHNAWATRELLKVCRPLTDEQLEATAAGTYGSIRATLYHLVESDGWYLGLLSGSMPEWMPDDDEPPPAMDELERWAVDVAAGWERFLAAGPVEPGRVISPREGEEVEAGVLIAQALNHGNEHRAQIYTLLTTIGVPFPELDGWAFGEAHGRVRET